MKSYALCYSESLHCNSNSEEVVILSRNLVQLNSILERINALGLNFRDYSVHEIILPISDNIFIPIVKSSGYDFHFSRYFLEFATHDLQNDGFYSHWVSTQFKVSEDDDIKVEKFTIYSSLTKEQIHNILADYDSSYKEVEKKNNLIKRGKHDFSKEYY
jgi:hypothetical protein